ncbi:hypothetical protein V1286_004904 [Bradyrhizobium algeriense]|uniref:Uncharacterized protein n=1 Tax=Bradyrhizobium algeriense TaxID=634784 RepID=A0ABU8BFY2_9BRAD
MIENPVFSLADASAIQIIALVGFAIATVAFLVWVAYLVRG